MQYFLFGETAFHHEGNVKSIYEMIDQNVEAGFNGVKFQILFNLSNFMSTKHSSYDEIQNMIISSEEWRSIIQYAQQKQLKIIIMPLDVEVVNWIRTNSLPIDYIEIHSVSFYDSKLLQAIKDTKIPVILGAGGRTLEEIENSIEYFEEQLEILMMGFQSFPTQLKYVKLGKIKWLSQKFPHLKIGYADHSSFNNDDGIQSLVYAYLLGAKVFEKHITCQEGTPKTDYESAIGLEKMKKIKMELDRIVSILSYEEKDYLSLNRQELRYRNRQKRLVAKGFIRKGEIISHMNTSFKVCDQFNNNECFDLKDFKKAIARIDISDDEIISRINTIIES